MLILFPYVLMNVLFSQCSLQTKISWMRQINRMLFYVFNTSTHVSATYLKQHANSLYQYLKKNTENNKWFFVSVFVFDKLCIETGRWHRPNQTPLSERIWHVCSILEDEYHFVLVCSLYINLRKQFIPSYCWKRPSMFKLIDLLNSNNVCLMQKLGSFINYAFKIRSDTLYLRR